MTTYKSILDSLLTNSSNIITANIRSLTKTFSESKLAHLPASSDTKISAMSLKKFNKLSQKINKKLEKFLHKMENELQEQYQSTVKHQYERPMTGTNGQLCKREQIQEKQQKGLVIIDQQYMAQGLDNVKFNNFKDFLSYEKKGKNIVHLDLQFKSQGITDNNTEHFMHKFIQYCNVQTLKIDLGCNSLETPGARQLAGCFTNLDHLTHFEFSIYNNKINWEGIDALMHAFSQLSNLRELVLDISCNPIGTKGFILVSQALVKMRKLNKLWLKAYNSGINDEQLKRFIIEFEKMPPLLVFKLDLRVNRFDKQLITLLKKLIHQKKMNIYEIEV